MLAAGTLSAAVLMALTDGVKCAVAQTLPQMIDIEWSLAPNMPQGLQDSDGGIIDNTLITAGGFARGETIPGKVYPRGFVHETWGLDLANPGAGWQSLPDFPGSNEPTNVDGPGRQELASVVVNNEIYAWGGFNYTDPFAYADGYRLSHAGGVWAWDALPPLPYAVSSPGVTAVGDFIYSVGGADYDVTKFYTNADRNGDTPRLGAKFHRLDTNNLQAGWTPLPELPGTPRWVHATASVGDQIYVFGGATGDEAASAFPYRSIVDNWRFDTVGGTWHRLADLPVSSGNFSNGQAVVDDRYILLIGGFQYEEVRNPDGTIRPKYGLATKTIPGNVYFSDIWVYDTLTDQFGTATQLPNNNNLPMAVVDGSKLYLLGGEAGGFTFDGELFGHHPESVFVGDMTVISNLSVSLLVDAATGAVRMQNVSTENVAIDGYEISSPSGLLNPANGSWQSLQDGGVHPGWLEIGSPNNTLLAELNANGQTILAPAEWLHLGTPYSTPTPVFGQPSPAGDLAFAFSVDGGDVLAGAVIYNASVNTLALQVDPTSGQAVLTNPTTVDVEIDGYEIRSSAGALQPDQWHSLSDNPRYAGWQEIGSPADQLVAELNSSDGLQLNSLAAITLGNLFDGAAEDLEFKFSLTSGEVLDGVVQYVGLDADFDLSGDIGGGDLLLWQRGAGLAAGATGSNGDANGDGAVNNIDRVVWEFQFGGTASSSSANAAVPEPGSLSLLLLGCCWFSGRRG